MEVELIKANDPFDGSARRKIERLRVAAYCRVTRYGLPKAGRTTYQLFPYQPCRFETPTVPPSPNDPVRTASHRKSKRAWQKPMPKCDVCS